VRITIYHNILWSKYKGAVFSQLSPLSKKRGVEASFVQIAETDLQRDVLGGVDLSYHNYPVRLLFRGRYNSVSIPKIMFALAKDLIKHPCDLVVMPNYNLPEHWAMLTLCILLRRKRAVVCDATKYDRPKVGWKEIGKRLFFARCNGLFCYGSRSKEYLMSYGVPEAKINIRCQAAALPHDYNTAEVLSYYSVQNAESFRPPRFVYIGRLSPEKGLHDLLNAFNLVRAKLPETKLDLIGAGPLKDELARRIDELGLQESVTLRGSLDLREIARYLLRSVALVLPSHSEPWGLVVNEALSYGCPVVVSDHCGCVPELVSDGMTGYAFKTGSIEALSAAMLAVVKLSENRVIAATQCIKVISPFTAERAASQMLDGFTRILEASG
jgi:glycosyltransferase involved in cell wall biosynthesis